PVYRVEDPVSGPHGRAYRGHHCLGYDHVSSLGQVIEVDVDWLPVLVKQRRQIKSIRRFGEFGTIAAFGNDCLVKRTAPCGVRRVVLLPALLIGRLKSLCRDHRLPEKYWAETIFAGQ